MGESCSSSSSWDDYSDYFLNIPLTKIIYWKTMSVRPYVRRSCRVVDLSHHQQSISMDNIRKNLITFLSFRPTDNLLQTTQGTGGRTAPFSIFSIINLCIHFGCFKLVSSWDLGESLRQSRRLSTCRVVRESDEPTIHLLLLPRAEP